MIEYSTSVDEVRAEDLDGFFVGWPEPPSPETHLDLLRGSSHVIVAHDTESGRVVGFVSSVGDGVLSAYIPLLEVLPEYQGRGIGTELVARMLSLLGDMYMVDVCCDEDLVPFYERFEMRPVVGMVRRSPRPRRRDP